MELLTYLGERVYSLLKLFEQLINKGKDRMNRKIVISALLLGFHTSFFAKTAITVVKGDIVQQSVDAIVNAANPQLQGGGGVCKAIFLAAGWTDLQKACDTYPLINGVRCPVGDARMTASFNLNSIGVKKIVHAVGPDARIIKDQEKQKTLLASAYTASLKLAVKSSLKTIAFPFISSGIYAMDHTVAAETAIAAVDDFVRKQPTALSEIRFVLNNQEDYDLFYGLLNP
jgi:O-acetyl-ADP-ribose deacetylase